MCLYQGLEYIFLKFISLSMIDRKEALYPPLDTWPQVSQTKSLVLTTCGFNYVVSSPFTETILCP